MSFTVYVISSISKKYIYVGITNDLSRRLNQHQSRKGASTAPYAPFKLLFTESSPTRQEARYREKYLKSGSGKEWIKRSFVV